MLKHGQMAQGRINTMLFHTGQAFKPGRFKDTRIDNNSTDRSNKMFSPIYDL
mgnify:CR=1 FL=1|jgi:hypothetical protein